MIWQLPFHNPMRLAQEVATLDHLSKGRVEFGSGLGTHEHEFIRWGIDYYDRHAASEEAMKVIEDAWTKAGGHASWPVLAVRRDAPHAEAVPATASAYLDCLPQLARL